MESLTILQELVARWKAKSPKTFKIITNLAVVVAFVTGLPELLEMFGLLQYLPEETAILMNKTVAIAATVGAIISKLTVATPETKTVLTEIKNEGESELNIE